MIFRQLFEPESSTYTYLLACPESRQAVLLDPVLDAVDRDLATIHDLGLTLAYTLETHVHADHITSAARLRSLVGSRIACPEMDGLAEADIGVSELQPLDVGTVRLKPLFTPGHTDAHHAYLVDGADGTRVMTGDALLIDGCGRTDFQGGSAKTLYHSIHDKIFTLPDDALVYPGHDYNHRHVSSVAEQRERNPRLGSGRSVDEFVAIMAALKLPYPKKMDVAVPANRRCGEVDELAC
jgi:glyoxylase-like metal-dependent hydrolase (beta-lactamase superfamily II)